MKTTLEQEAKKQTGIGDSRPQCGYCDAGLQISKTAAQKMGLNRNGQMLGSDPKRKYKGQQHNGFYLSPGGSPYCNEKCFTMFTED
ncbi:hypothetical protein GOV14_06005 [Candidatus Pacearchaeota archaeon]|nr:hypothetical protein [Candidatus Pacearchaeota archaeon]